MAEMLGEHPAAQQRRGRAVERGVELAERAERIGADEQRREQQPPAAPAQLGFEPCGDDQEDDRDRDREGRFASADALLSALELVRS